MAYIYLAMIATGVLPILSGDHDGPRCTTHPEEPACHFLAGANRGQGTVAGFVEIQLQRLLLNGDGFLTHVLNPFMPALLQLRCGLKGTRETLSPYALIQVALAVEKTRTASPADFGRLHRKALVFDSRRLLLSVS
jgi:hypothetical protein